MSIALRIQDAPLIPGPAHFSHVYEHRMTALHDGVKIRSAKDQEYMKPEEKTVKRVLNEGETLRGQLALNRRNMNQGDDEPDTLFFFNLDEESVGNVYADDVNVECAPQDTEYVRRYFPDLPIIPADLRRL